MASLLVLVIYKGPLFEGKNAPVLNTLPSPHDFFQGVKGHWSVIIVIHPNIPILSIIEG